MSEPSKSLRDIVSFQTRDSGSGAGVAGKMLAGGGFGGRFRTKLIVGAAFALICAGGAAYLSNVWLQSQMDRYRSADTEAPAPEVIRVPTRTVVVAASDLAYGAEITAETVREIEWPEESVPEGTFETVDALLSEQSRVALVALSRNEVVLQTRVSGPGQRASLSAMLDPGMKAVAIRVDDVLGVAGLIQPGDRVDVIWTRSAGGARSDDSYTELLLRDIKVLAIDQRVDDGDETRDGKADVARAVTVEVDVIEAQRVALAANSGKLFLALRHLGEEVDEASRRVTMNELGIRPQSDHSRSAPQQTETERELAAANFGVRMLAASSGGVPLAEEEPVRHRRHYDDYVVIGVRRGLERSEYNVMTTQR